MATDFDQIVTAPLLTAQVLGQTIPPGAADLLLPGVPVPNRIFDYVQHDTQHLTLVNAKRGMRAPIGAVESKGRKIEASLERFSLKAGADAAEFAEAAGPGGDPLFRAKKANQARIMVMNQHEAAVASLLTNTSTYASGYSVTLAGGSEWDSAGGDSKVDINTAAEAILEATGVGLSGLRVFMSEQSYMAALMDPVFRATRQYSSFREANAADLAAYYGVSRVDVRNPIYTDGTYGAALTPMYGDSTIVYAPTDPVGFDRFAGTMTFGVTFQWNAGVALAPFYEANETTWWFPWEHWVRPAVLTNNAGYLIKNCKA